MPVHVVSLLRRLLGFLRDASGLALKLSGFRLSRVFFDVHGLGWDPRTPTPSARPNGRGTQADLSELVHFAGEPFGQLLATSRFSWL